VDYSPPAWTTVHLRGLHPETEMHPGETARAEDRAT